MSGKSRNDGQPGSEHGPVRLAVHDSAGVALLANAVVESTLLADRVTFDDGTLRVPLEWCDYGARERVSGSLLMARWRAPILNAELCVHRVKDWTLRGADGHGHEVTDIRYNAQDNSVSIRSAQGLDIRCVVDGLHLEYTRSTSIAGWRNIATLLGVIEIESGRKS